MKTQSLLLLLALILLCGCPQENSTPESSPSPSVSLAPPPPLEPVTEFPKEHMNCCWASLSELDNYESQVLKAYNGDAEALGALIKQTQSLQLEQVYGHGAVLADILTHIGDQRFAAALQQQAAILADPNPIFEGEPTRYTLRNSLEGGFFLNESEQVRKQNLANFKLTSDALSYRLGSQ